MAEKAEKNEKKSNNQIPNNVVPLAADKCLAEGCKSKPSKAGFCAEHFDWFKAGLITKSGQRALDFDKKYYQYTMKKKAA